MPIPFGIHKMKVVSHGLFESSGEKRTPYVGIVFEHDSGEKCNVQVYVSDAAAGMARKSLKKLDFDIDKQSIYALNSNPRLLAGHEADVECFEDDYGGKVRTKYQLVLSDKPLEATQASKLDAVLRAAKSEDEKADKPKVARSPKRAEQTAIEKEVAAHKADVAAHADDEENF